MSDERELLGHAIYNPDDADDPNTRMVCVGCNDDPDPPEGMTRATVKDSAGYGAEPLYPECAECGEVMRVDPIEIEA